MPKQWQSAGSTDSMGEDFWLLHSEAALAAGLIGNGLTLFRKANFIRREKINEALFNYSIGLERLLKLILILTHHNKKGAFPTKSELKTLGHDLNSLLTTLLARLDGINIKNSDPTLFVKEPYKDILVILTAFAKEARYYNLDKITEGRNDLSPLQQWDTKIHGFIRRDKVKKKGKHYKGFMALNQGMKENVMIFTPGYSGRSVDTFGEYLENHAETKTLQAYTVLFLAQIVRELAKILRASGEYGHLFSEFYLIYIQPDSFLRSKRAWSQYI